MSDTASKRYGEALEHLKNSSPIDYRAVKRRVESWKTIANKWRKQAEDLQRTVVKLEAQLAMTKKHDNDKG